MIVSASELDGVRAEHTEDTIALRFGTFDLLHAGHAEGLEFAARQADVLVVGVMSDEMVRRNKGPSRPIYPDNIRARTIDGAKGVDFSFIMPSRVFYVMRAIRRLSPDVYVEHEEYGSSRLRSLFLGVIGTRYLIDDGAKIDSTTAMIERLGLDGALKQSKLDHG